MPTKKKIPHAKPNAKKKKKSLYAVTTSLSWNRFVIQVAKAHATEKSFPSVSAFVTNRLMQDRKFREDVTRAREEFDANRMADKSRRRRKSW